jgi:acetyl esterase/lipase
MQPVPVLVILHGGCWQAAVADLDHISALAEAFRQEGFATWNVEYRRLGETGGGWPGTFQDAGAALDYVRELNRRYPGRLDTMQVVVIGHSAGGHLASWLAARPLLPADWATGMPSKQAPPKDTNAPLRPTGVVNLDGPADLRFFEDANGLFCGPGIIGQLLGGPRSQYPVRWRYASPVNSLPWRVPVRLLMGSNGMMTPGLNQDFLDLASLSGDTATRLIVVPNIDHFQLIDPKSSAWPTVRRAVQTLVKPAPLQPAPHRPRKGTQR